MKKLDHTEVLDDIEKRMIEFESFRTFKKANSKTVYQDLQNTLLEYYAVNDKYSTDIKPTTNIPQEIEVNAKPIPKPETKKPANKESKGFLNIISDFFSDDPIAEEAKRQAALLEKQKQLEAKKTLKSKK